MATRQIQIDGDELLAVMRFVETHGDDLARLASLVPDSLGRAGESLGAAGAASLEASAVLTHRDAVDAVDVTAYTASALDECSKRLGAIGRVLTRAEKRADTVAARDIATSNDQITTISESLTEAAAGLRELGAALGIVGERLGEVGGELQRGGLSLTEARDGRRTTAPRRPPKRSTTPAERPRISRDGSSSGPATTKRSGAQRPTPRKKAETPATKRSGTKRSTSNRSQPEGMQPTGRSARSSAKRD
jgi:hypothetical protein